MRRNLLLSLAFLGLAFPGAVVAEEIVYFTNGTTMAIISHKVENEMVHVDLGSDAFMAFPEYMVERIEKAGDNVYLPPSFRRTNIATSRSGGAPVRMGGNVPNTASFPVSGSTSISSRFRGRPKNEKFGADWVTGYTTPGSKPGAFGLQTHYPLSTHTNRAARKLGVVDGRPFMDTPPPSVGGDQMIGAVRFGSKHVIMTPGHASPPARSTVGRIKVKPGLGVPQMPPSGGDSGSSSSRGKESSDSGQN